MDGRSTSVPPTPWIRPTHLDGEREQRGRTFRPRGLRRAIPIPDPPLERRRQRILLEGDMPSPANPPPGCHFHTRCPYAFDRCKVDVPALREARPGQWVACHLR